MTISPGDDTTARIRSSTILLTATLTGDGVIFTWILPFVKMLLSPFKCDGIATLWDDDEFALSFSRGLLLGVALGKFRLPQRDRV